MSLSTTYSGSRDGVHDLRNIMGVIASVSHLLDDRPGLDRKRDLLSSLDAAVSRGTKICNTLLTVHAEPVARYKLCAIDQSIDDMAPFLRAAAGGSLVLSFDQTADDAHIPMTQGELEIMLVELLTNARKYAVGAQNVLIRTRRVGDAVWIFVADDGAAQITRQRPSYSGHGLLRLERVAAEAGGSLRIRKLHGGGMAVAVCLPVRPTARVQLRSPIPQAREETYHEDRQPIAA